MSKELKALEKINEIILPYSEAKQDYLRPRDVCQNEFEIIENALKKLEKIENTNYSVLREDISNKLKALEIIKEKPVVALVDYKYTYQEWLELVDEREKDLFRNQEEYDLLREVLL